MAQYFTESIDVRTLILSERERYFELITHQKQMFACQSQIQGKGVISGELIREGDFILELCGERENQKKKGDGEDREVGEKRNGFEFMSASGNLVIDSEKSSGPAKYINHSCVPNCEMVTVNLKKIGGETLEVMFIKAIRDIYLFEEVTICYPWIVGKRDIMTICECCEDKCRGVVEQFAFPVEKGAETKSEDVTVWEGGDSYYRREKDDRNL